MFSHKYKHHAWVAVGGKGNSLWTTFKRKNKSQEELELDFEFMLFDCADWTLDLLKLIFLAFTYFLLCLNKIFQAVLFFFCTLFSAAVCCVFSRSCQLKKNAAGIDFLFCMILLLLLSVVALPWPSCPPSLPSLPPSVLSCSRTLTLSLQVWSLL